MSSSVYKIHKNFVDIFVIKNEKRQYRRQLS